MDQPAISAAAQTLQQTPHLAIAQPQTAGTARGNPAAPSTGEIRDMPAYGPAERTIIPDQSGPLARNENQDYREPPRMFVNRRTGSKIREVNKQGTVGDGTPKPATKAAKTETPAPPAETLSPEQQERADRHEMRVQEQRMNRALDTRRASRTAGGYAAADKIYQDARKRYYELSDKYPKAAPAAPEARPLTQAQQNMSKENAPPSRAPASTGAAEKPEARPLSKGRETPTFDQLPAEAREALDNWRKQIPGLPQSLREAEMEELEKYGGQGVPINERLAKRYLEQQNAPPEPGEERPGGGTPATNEEMRARMRREGQERDTRQRRQKPERDY